MSEPLDKRKEYPARMFYRATVVCPSCHQRFNESDDQCQRCGFDAYQTVDKFPYTPPVMERVMDNAGIIDDKLHTELDLAVDKLIEKFPQVGMYFCTVEMEDPVSLSEFGFWMMNACRLQEGQVERDRAWSILLLIDVQRGLISLTPGYAIEAFIEDSGWENALRGASEDLAAGDYRSAILGYIKCAEKLLYTSAKDVKKKVRMK